MPENFLKCKRILLVEDNELNVEIARTILQDVQAEVEVAADGAIAVAMLQKAPVGYYDVILMDIQMPKMNGYQATEAIRKLPDERAQVPIIAMTANAFEEDRQVAFAAGMDDYLAKPIEIDKLLRKLVKVLERSKRRQIGKLQFRRRKRYYGDQNSDSESRRCREIARHLQLLCEKDSGDI